MKIGDEVYVKGYIDEIRKDTVIIRNEGGYFGTIQSEIVPIPDSRTYVVKLTTEEVRFLKENGII